MCRFVVDKGEEEVEWFVPKAVSLATFVEAFEGKEEVVMAKAVEYFNTYAPRPLRGRGNCCCTTQKRY